MAKLSNEELIEAFKELTIIELSEFVKLFEETFEVTAAAVAVAGPAGAAAEEVEEKTDFDVVLEAFGPDRLMFGSDWPVCLVGIDYQRWGEVVREWTDSLTTSEQERIFGGTAIEAYGLDAHAADADG